MLSSAHFMAVVYTRDLGRARAFYEGVLGFTVVHEDPMGLELAVGGARVRVGIQDGFVPRDGTVVGWFVDDVAAVIGWLAAKGIDTERYPGMQQDELGVWQPYPGGPRIAWFRDPDGNTLSIRQD